MSDDWFLAASFSASVCGMAWLALAMEAHWCQVRTQSSPSPARARKLRRFGAVALLLSLIACLLADHASIAGLVWIMTLSASAVTVALTLAYRPRLLSLFATLSESRKKVASPAALNPGEPTSPGSA